MTGPVLTLKALNDMPSQDFVAVLADVFEHGAWVADAAMAGRPFSTVTALHDAMMAAIANAPHGLQLEFLRGHPELGGKVARAGAMAEASIAEQGSLGLDRLSDVEFDTFERLNAAYRAKFAIPFIICVGRHTRDSILRRFEQRLDHDVETEFAAAVQEIGYITRLRLARLVQGPGQPKVDGRLSTHVLDVVQGRAAAGVGIALYEVGASARALLKSVVTNDDGRTDEPLLGGAPLRAGVYELQFAIADYFRSRGTAIADPPFLDIVSIRFSIAEPESHYHIALLVSPWGYTTYRGS